MTSTEAQAGALVAASQNVPEPEARLVMRAKDAPAAFGELYEQHYATILAYLYRRTFNAAVAEDLTAGTFFKALKALPRYTPRASFRAWLYRIATNELKMHWRRLGVRRGRAELREEMLDRARFGPSPSPDPGDAMERMEQYVQLHRALGELPERYQTVIVLRYVEDLTLAEVAAATGKRLGTVKSLIHRGLKRLRKVLADGGATFPDSPH